MEDKTPSRCAPLPLCALRLLVPPIRLVSAAIWQTVQQKVVADYGMLEEFVSVVTDIVPELLTPRQRAQLIMGLRARLILELCQFEATADIGLVQPHLDRVQTLIETWVMEGCASNMKVPHSKFVDLIKDLLKNRDAREHFFQEVFPVEFGPTYDDALHDLMWLFLSRLERFLPFQTFQQVSSMFGEASSVLDECMDSVSRCQELKTLLQYQKHVHQLDPDDGSLDGSCIISALKLALEERTATDKPRADISDNTPSDVEAGSLTSTTADQTQVDETSVTPGAEGAAGRPGGAPSREENAVLAESRAQKPPGFVKQCRVQLKRLDLPPLPPRRRPARPNRGLRMEKILLEEKRGLREEAVRKAEPGGRARPHSDEPVGSSHMAPVDSDDSWSFYSGEDSCREAAGGVSAADSWSDDSGDGSPSVAPVGGSPEGGSNDPSFTGPKKVSASGRKRGVAAVPKKTRKAQCCICNEAVSAGLRTHMETHFPSGDYACPRCDSRFKLFSSLRLHVNRTCFEHGRRGRRRRRADPAAPLFECDECGEAFGYGVSLERHKRTHDGLYCEVCRKVLRDPVTLARHKSSHTAFQCNRCEETFALFKPLLRHCENVHRIGRPFQCNYCPKAVGKLRALIAHEWKHTGHLPFRCALCSARFKSDAALASHQLVHTRERPYLCAECGKTFSQRSNLLRHLTFLHSEARNGKSYSCSECEKSFKDKGALKTHQKAQHRRQRLRHPCPSCGKMVSASSMARHKLIHTGEKPFGCTAPDCDKAFRSASEVKRHVLAHHTTERPFRCDACGKGFNRACYLNAHAKTHSAEKPFVCHFCGKAFPKRYNMQRHKQLVHAAVTH